MARRCMAGFLASYSLDPVGNEYRRHSSRLPCRSTRLRAVRPARDVRLSLAPMYAVIGVAVVVPVPTVAAGYTFQLLVA